MITLRKMQENEFAEYLKVAVPNYANEKMKGEGHSPEQATKIAQEAFAQLLPKGLQSENQFLFSVIEASSNKVVGTLWFARKQAGHKSSAYIYDIILNEEVRGRGYGTQLIQLTEAEVKKLGLSSIGLHVFGHNMVARKLYEKMGFNATNIIMVKELE